MVQLAFHGSGVSDRVVERHACRPPVRRPASHGSRHRPILAGQLSLLEWRAPRAQLSLPALERCRGSDVPSPPVEALLSSLDSTSAALTKLAAVIVADALPPRPAIVPPPRRPAKPRKPGRPTHYSECIERGLGITQPCPFYSCRAHLGLYTLDDGTVRVLIPPDQIDTEKHTCIYAAADHEWAPVAIAAQLRVSLGLVELIQRHGVAKTGGLLARVRDERRACSLDVDGLSDCRR